MVSEVVEVGELTVVRQVAAALPTARCDGHVGVAQRSVSLQVLEALLEADPVRIPARILRFSVQVNSFAIRNLGRSRHVVSQASIPPLQRNLAWLRRGERDVRQLLLLHGALLILGSTPASEPQIVEVRAMVTKLRSNNKRWLLVLILQALALRLPISLGEHERRLATPILLEDALL